MVSTLRITSVAIILLAGLVVVLVAGPSSLVPNLLASFALSGDPEVARIVNEADVVKDWQEKHGDSAPAQDTTPALVREAEAFKNIIDPPPPPMTDNGGDSRSPVRPNPRPVIKPIQSTAQFTLVGTTVSADDSFAYIRLADKTYRWARKGDEIGHLTIKEIRNGSIVCFDGQAETEMTTESVPETASLLEAGGGAPTQSTVSSHSALRSPSSPGGRITGEPVARPWSSGLSANEGEGEMNDQEREALGDLVGRLRELQQRGGASPDVGLTPEAREAAVKKLIAEYKSSRTDSQEAEKVEESEGGQEQSPAPAIPDADKLRDVRRKLNIPRSIRR